MTVAVLSFMAVQVVLGLASAKYAFDCHYKQRIAEAQLAQVRKENDALHRELERNNTAYRHAFDRSGGVQADADDMDHH